MSGKYQNSNMYTKCYTMVYNFANMMSSEKAFPELLAV